MKFSISSRKHSRNYWMDINPQLFTTSFRTIPNASTLSFQVGSPILAKCTLNLSVFLTVSFLIMFLICHLFNRNVSMESKFRNITEFAFHWTSFLSGNSCNPLLTKVNFSISYSVNPRKLALILFSFP